MTYGAAIFLIAVGAILRFAITESVRGLDLGVVGLILIGAGVVGLVIGMFQSLQGRSMRSVTSTATPMGERVTETRQTVR